MTTPTLPPLPKAVHSMKVKSAAGQEWQYPVYSEGEMQAYARAAIEQQGVPDGWQLVPKEPTPEMIEAAEMVKQFTLSTPYERWAVMLASSPAPQAAPASVWQEPVAIRYRFHYPDDGSTPYRAGDWRYTQGPWDQIPDTAKDVSALYTHPAQQAKPLSDEQIDAVTFAQWGEMKGFPLASHRAYARAIESAHGIKE